MAEILEIVKSNIYNYSNNKEEVVFVIAKNYINGYQNEFVLHINSKSQCYQTTYKEYISMNFDEEIKK